MERFVNGWLVERDLRAGARMRLFCLPHAGSGAAAFYRWKRLLPEWIDVCPVMLPGREIRLGEASETDCRVLMDALHAAARAYLDVPYAIFGHSMGGLLAYEWALRIEEGRLREPLCLFVSGREAVHVPWRHPVLHGLGDAAFVEELRRRYGGMPQDFLEDAALREVFLPILRADLRLVETYRHLASPPLRCPLMAFAGRNDPLVLDEGLKGWRALTCGDFAAERFPGNHFYHFGVGQIELLRAVSERLQRLLPPPPERS